MRITCPTCSTQYDVDENDISFTGQDVQCTECMTVWTQARNGEATNPRLAGAVVDDGEEISSEEDETLEAEEVPLEDATASIMDEEPDEDTQDDEIAELEELDGTVPEPETENDDLADDPVEPDALDDDDDEDENPIWKEIAALAQEARSDSDSESTDSEYSPPDDMPPIQTQPVVPDEAELSADDDDDEDRPWDAAADSEEGFSDFVWNDPSNGDDDEPETDDSSADKSEPEFTALEETSDDALDNMDDDLISAALNEQMAIEDALEDAPKSAGRDISDVPVELGGPRARTPNVEALKDSVRSKSVKLTTEELKEQVPARRFRRGLSFILLVFVILGAVYIARNTITEYIPAVGPYLESYATFVDLLRTKAEVLGAYVWDLVMQAYNAILTRFFN